MTEFVDPPAPPEGGQHLNAKDLKNQILIIRPTDMGEWPAKPQIRDEGGEVTQEAKDAQPYVAADVWVLDRAGITDEDKGVRFSWWKAVEQLKDQMGQFVACKPVEDGRAVVLIALAGEAREVAKKAVEMLSAPDGTEPM